MDYSFINSIVCDRVFYSAHVHIQDIDDLYFYTDEREGSLIATLYHMGVRKFFFLQDGFFDCIPELISLDLSLMLAQNILSTQYTIQKHNIMANEIIAMENILINDFKLLMNCPLLISYLDTFRKPSWDYELETNKILYFTANEFIWLSKRIIYKTVSILNSQECKHGDCDICLTKNSHIPRFWPCNHSVCTTCILSQLYAVQYSIHHFLNQEMTCPFCRESCLPNIIDNDYHPQMITQPFSFYLVTPMDITPIGNFECNTFLRYKIDKKMVDIVIQLDNSFYFHMDSITDFCNDSIKSLCCVLGKKKTFSMHYLIGRKRDIMTSKVFIQCLLKLYSCGQLLLYDKEDNDWRLAQDLNGLFQIEFDHRIYGKLMRNPDFHLEDQIKPDILLLNRIKLILPELRKKCNHQCEFFDQ